MKISDDGTIMCPECSSDYTHLKGVSVIQLDTKTFVSPQGTKVLPRKEVPTERGSRIGVLSQCENGGHEFLTTLQFHKGQTFVQSFPTVSDPEIKGSLQRD